MSRPNPEDSQSDGVDVVMTIVVLLMYLVGMYFVATM